MQRIDLKSSLLVMLALCAWGCENHDSKLSGSSTASSHTTQDGTEEQMLDAKITLSPGERSQLAQASNAGNGPVHIAEEAGMLKIFTGEAPSGQARTETTVALSNHSDVPKPPLHVNVTPEALAVMRTREKQGGTPAQ